MTALGLPASSVAGAPGGATPFTAGPPWIEPPALGDSWPIFGEPPHLRAADADRERMAAFLGQCYAEGRLNGEELSTRVEAAYRAVTYADLAAVASDLPTAPVARPGERLRRGVPRIYSSGGLVLVALPTYALIDVLFPLPFLGTLAFLVGVVVVTAHLALRTQPGARAGRPVLRPDLGPQRRAADREASHARRLPRLSSRARRAHGARAGRRAPAATALSAQAICYGCWCELETRAPTRLACSTRELERCSYCGSKTGERHLPPR